MKQSLQLRLGQHLAMTPQLQQAIRLLQLSALELQTEIQQALESNVMLETDEESETADEASGNGGLRERSDREETPPVDIPEQLPVDTRWEDIYEGSGSGGGYADGDEGSGESESQWGSSETLRDQLRWQLGLSHLSEVDALIGEAIIDAIDDDGYLKASLEEIRDSILAGGSELDIDVEDVRAVLRQVQNFEPPGVGARDPRECLLIQLEQLPAEVPWHEQAMRLVGEYLDLYAGHDYAQLMRRMELEKHELMEVFALIQSLNPRPGSLIESQPPQYVVPDVFVYKKNGRWVVELNPDVSPRLRINAQYAQLARDAGGGGGDAHTLKSHLQEARWFLKSLKSRSETLLKVASCIVERQQMFLEHGEEAMKPMVLHDVAEAVGVHESTISRVTTQKYMHTPRGIYELKYFFSSHVSTASGGEASSIAIRALLKKLIAAENPQRPLSDSKLAAILSESGINVARRTVAKYREAMSIPSSSERRRLM